MGGYGSSQDFARQMMGALLGSMLQGIFAPPQQDTSYQYKLWKQQMEKKKQEALKKQAMERWKKLKKEEEKRMAQEEAKKRQRARELLSKMENISGSRLEPFGWKTQRLEVQPIGAGIYDTSGYTSWQRMLCATYFSTKAIEASRGGDAEAAVFMNRQADRVTVGEMTEVECQLPALQQLANIQRQNLKQNKRLTEIVKLLPKIQAKIKHLQEIEIKLNEVKRQKKEAEAKLKEARTKVEEAKAQAESSRTPEEKAEADDLLQQALALQNEAEAQVEKAKQAEKGYTEIKKKEMMELRNMENDISVISSDHYREDNY